MNLSETVMVLSDDKNIGLVIRTEDKKEIQNDSLYVLSGNVRVVPPFSQVPTAQLELYIKKDRRLKNTHNKFNLEYYIVLSSSISSYISVIRFIDNDFDILKNVNADCTVYYASENLIFVCSSTKFFAYYNEHCLNLSNLLPFISTDNFHERLTHTVAKYFSAIAVVDDAWHWFKDGDEGNVWYNFYNTFIDSISEDDINKIADISRKYNLKEYS